MINYTTWFTQQLDVLGDWEWTETGVDVVLSNKDHNKTITCKRLLDFVEKIEIAYLGIGNITKLYDAGLKTPEDIINAAKNTLVSILGENGNKVYTSMVTRLNSIPLYKLIGAHSTQRGIGVRKMHKLELALGGDFNINPTLATIKVVEGFDTITAAASVVAINQFNEFFQQVNTHVTIKSAIATSSTVAGIKFCFSGFRNKELQSQIEAKGGTVSSSVSKNTNYVVTTDPSGTSSKLKKARELKIPIIEEPELITLLAE